MGIVELEAIQIELDGTLGVRVKQIGKVVGQLQLGVAERLKLVEDLWDSIAAEQNNLPLTEAQKAELDSRLDEFELDGKLGEPAEIVLKEIRSAL